MLNGFIASVSDASMLHGRERQGFCTRVANIGNLVIISLLSLLPVWCPACEMQKVQQIRKHALHSSFASTEFIAECSFH